jgi:C-terminal processing protease CtpA/Prc
LNESFPLLFNILYGTKDNYNVSYKTQSGEIKTATLQADTLKNILCPPPFSRPKKYLQLTYESKDVAVLSVKTFFDGFLKQTGEEISSKFLDSAFTDIKNNKIKKLLIDIRGNQGGNDGNGELLYSYLTAKPFMYYSSQETNTEKFSPKDHLQFIIATTKRK